MVETSTPVGCRGAAPRRDAEGGEQNQNDGGRGWFIKVTSLIFRFLANVILQVDLRTTQQHTAQ